MKQAQTSLEEKVLLESAFAIVVSQFNEKITTALLEGALARLSELGLRKEKIKIVQVPGAIEIPLAAKLLAKSGNYQVLICLGAVIRGETSHYDYVCAQVSEGCQQVMMTYEIPLIFGILTTENEEQARARAGGEQGHKGREAVDAAMQMLAVVNSLK